MSTINDVEQVMRDVFDEEDLVVSETTSAADVDGWDSINHVRLVIALEAEFNIRMPTEKVNELRNVGELVTLIDELRR